MDSKMEIESVLCKYSVKEEGTDGDNIKRENDEIKKEFEAETCHSWDQVWDGTEQNTEESPHIDIKEIKLGQSEVEFKLESISDEEVNEDEIDAPNSISSEGFNGKQEDTVHKKNEPKTRKARSCRNLFECSICGHTYSTEINLRQHMMLHLAPIKNRPRPRYRRRKLMLFECSTCGHTYSSEITLRRHMILHLAPKNRPTYDCDMCDFKSMYISTFRKHKLKHANRPDWPGKLKNKYNTCDKCAYPARNYSELKIHEQTHKARSNCVQCSICGSTFVRESSLKKHMVLHMDPKDRPRMYDCDICTFKSISKNSLRSHKSRHMIQASPESVELKKGPKKLKCDKCSSDTHNCVHLTTHEQTHKTRSTRNRFDCPTCTCSFTRKYDLKQHMAYHMDPKSRPTYDCDICNFKTVYETVLMRHKSRHTVQANPESAELKKRPKIFICGNCSYWTEESYKLRRHEQTHKPRSDRDLFECATCGCTFTSKGSLKKHVQLHIDPKYRSTYDCDLCDYKTIVRHSLKVHKFRHANRGEFAFVECKNEIEESEIQM